MSYGFEAKNDSGQVLVSQEMRNLHFVEKASYVGMSSSMANYGGSQTLTYHTKSFDTPIPFFTMPTDGNSYGVSRIYGSLGNWTVEIIHSSYRRYVQIKTGLSAFPGAVYGENDIGAFFFYPSGAVINTGYIFTTPVGYWTWHVTDETGEWYGHNILISGGQVVGGTKMYKWFYGDGQIQYIWKWGWETPALGPLPEVYIFSTLLGRTTTEKYGLYVQYGDSRTPTVAANPQDASFDSRFSPLVVTGGVQVAPPYNPYDNGISGTGNPKVDAWYSGAADSVQMSDSFTPKNTVTSIIPNVPSKPIYSYSSMGQCQRQAGFVDDFSEFDGVDLGWLGKYGVTRTYHFQSEYWCFYRSVITKDPNGIKCLWASVRKGSMATRVEGRSVSGLDIIFGVAGFLTGGVATAIGGAMLGTVLDASGNTWSGSGFWPYSNKTLNTLPSTVLVSDGSLYD